MYIECLRSALEYFEGFKDETVKYKIAFLTNSVVGKNGAWGCNTIGFNLTMIRNYPQDVMHSSLGKVLWRWRELFKSVRRSRLWKDVWYSCFRRQGRPPANQIRKTHLLATSIARAKLNLFETSTRIRLDVYLTYYYLIYFPCQVSGGNSSQCQAVNVLLHNPVLSKLGNVSSCFPRPRRKDYLLRPASS